MFKSANVGPIDRLIRIVVGMVLIAAPYVIASELWSNTLIRWGAPAVGAILILTAMFRFCPLYRLIGTSTCKTG